MTETLRLVIDGDSKGGQRALLGLGATADQVDGKFQRFADRVDQASKDMDTSLARLGDRMQDVGGKLTLGVTLPTVVGFGLMTKAASSLNEAQNKVTVVFDESAESVLRWGKSTADAIGQSERQALAAAGTYGNLFVAMGMGSDEAASMSMNLVNLASDLASFNDTTPEDALEALRSGLVGETEPLKRFGVNLNEATLKAQALAMGLEWSGATLPPLIKAQAAYALIMEQTTKAQGDYSRTSEEVANATRTVAAEAEDLAAAWGEELLPIVEDALSVAKPILGFFGELPGPVKKTAIAIGFLAAAAGPAVYVLGTMLKAREAWGSFKTWRTERDTRAVDTNTRAVERNTRARQRNSSAPAVGSGWNMDTKNKTLTGPMTGTWVMQSSGGAYNAAIGKTVPGVVGTGASGLGVAGVTAAKTSFLGGASIGSAALEVGSATIATTYAVIEATNAFGEWWGAEKQDQAAAEARGQSIGKAIGQWQAEHPGQKIPPWLQQALDDFKDSFNLGMSDLQKGPLGFYFKSERNQAAADALNKAIKVYSSGNAQAIDAYQKGLEATDAAATASDKTALASDQNTAAIEGLTGAVDEAAVSIDSLATASLDQINAMMALPGGIAGALSAASAAEARETAAAMLRKRYKNGIDWTQVADTPGGNVDIAALYKEMGWKLPKRKLALGGTVPARPGGTPVIAAEAGEDEDFVPASKRKAYARAVLGGGGTSLVFDFSGAQFGAGLTQRDVEAVLTERVVPRVLDALAVA